MKRFPSSEIPVALIHTYWQSPEGNKPSVRTQDAAEVSAYLYKKNRLNLILLTGGPAYPNQKSRADLMKEIMTSRGVPPEAFLTSNSAQNTDLEIKAALSLAQSAKISSFASIATEAHLPIIRILRANNQLPPHWSLSYEAIARKNPKVLGDVLEDMATLRRLGIERNFVLYQRGLQLVLHAFPHLYDTAFNSMNVKHRGVENASIYPWPFNKMGFDRRFPVDLY